MSKNIILIATWGDPKRWESVRYKMFKIPSELKYTLESMTEEQYFENKSTTSALARCIFEKKCIDDYSDLKIIVIVSETLVNPDKIDGQGTDLLRMIRDSVSDSIKVYIKSDDYFGEKLYDKVDLIVAPGIGFIEAEGVEFRCNIDNYTTYVFKELIEKTVFVNYIPDYILLDISHGINYMPVATLNIIKEFADIIALMKQVLNVEDKSVGVIVVNSDPYIPSRGASRGDYAKDKPVLNIGTVLIDKLDAKNIIQRVYEEIYSYNYEKIRFKYSRKPKDVKFRESLESTLKEHIDSAKMIVRWLRQGLLLPAYYEIRDLCKRYQMKEKQNFQNINVFMNDIKKIFNDVTIFMDQNADYVYEKSLSEQERSQHYQRKSVRLKVYRYAIIDQKTLPMFFKSFLVSYNIMKEFCGSYDLYENENLIDLDFLNKLTKHISIEGLRRIAENEIEDIRYRVRLASLLSEDFLREKIFRYRMIYDFIDEIRKLLLIGDRDLSDRINILRDEKISSKELENLKNILLNKISYDDINRIINDLLKKYVDKDCNFDIRNFFAHASFEKNITMIRIVRKDSDVKIYLGYSSECLDNIRKRIKDV